MEHGSNGEVLRPLSGNTFRFKCHREIACFTRCCAALDLLLTPYDILRLKQRLGLTSEDFLDRYGDTVFERHPRFPLVMLRMVEGPQKKCPFVSPSGCILYEDRPSSCRLYPLGRAFKLALQADPKEKYFLVKEAHCLGFQEDHEWTVEEWVNSEGMDEYNTMNDLWLEILSSPKSLGSGKDLERRIQMFVMASYDLDKFRGFIFEGPFLRRFELDQSVRDELRTDDLALLRFAFQWLKFSLFGESSPQIKIRS